MIPTLKRIKAFLTGGHVVVPITAIFFSSCDPYGGYQYWIDNKSDSALFIVLRNNNATTFQKLSIQSNTSSLVGGFESVNGIRDYGDDFIARYWDSVAIFIDTVNHVAIKKEYLKRDSWSYDADKTKRVGFAKSGDNIYRLEVANTDLK
jgi:hypothetical protein